MEGNDWGMLDGGYHFPPQTIPNHFPNLSEIATVVKTLCITYYDHGHILWHVWNSFGKKHLQKFCPFPSQGTPSLPSPRCLPNWTFGAVFSSYEMTRTG